jgi:hypothetical protein
VVDHVNGQFHHLVQAGAKRVEHGGEVRVGLSHLCGEVRQESAGLVLPATAAELGKEGLRGRRMVREAVQDDRRLTIGIITLQRVKGAVW